MPAYYLEALTVTLGLILLMAEAFLSKTSKAWVGKVAAIGLVLLIVAAFFAVGPVERPDRPWATWPLWNF